MHPLETGEINMNCAKFKLQFKIQIIEQYLNIFSNIIKLLVIIITAALLNINLCYNVTRFI